MFSVEQFPIHVVSQQYENLVSNPTLCPGKHTNTQSHKSHNHKHTNHTNHTITNINSNQYDVEWMVGKSIFLYKPKMGKNTPIFATKI